MSGMSLPFIRRASRVDASIALRIGIARMKSGVAATPESAPSISRKAAAESTPAKASTSDTRGPVEIADRAAAPLNSRNLWAKKRAPVAGALQGGRNRLLGQALQIGQSQSQRLRNQSVYGKPVGVCVDRSRPREVLADMQNVRGRNPRVEVVYRRFQIF